MDVQDTFAQVLQNIAGLLKTAGLSMTYLIGPDGENSIIASVEIMGPKGISNSFTLKRPAWESIRGTLTITLPLAEATELSTRSLSVTADGSPA